MKPFCLIFCVFICGHVAAQSNLNLKARLDSLMVLDQKYRNILTLVMQDSLSKDSVARSFNKTFSEITDFLWQKQIEIDSTNLSFIEKVFKEYGYPGKSMVGIETNEVAWYVIQHSDKIGEYIKLIRKAGAKKELAHYLVAMMTDRYLMQNNKVQIYGSQGSCRATKDGSSKCFIWPIKNPKKVNKLRRKKGFDSTVEENAKRLNIEYKVLTLNEIIRF